MKELKDLQALQETIQSLYRTYEDIQVLIEMGYEEEDPEMIREIEAEIASFETLFEELRIQTLLSGEYDGCNAIVTIHAGAGGTESCDWAGMLYRMYSRWAERKGFSLQIQDYLEGDIAGTKSVTFEVNGENAYGYLKSEKGVHRLVRISPFNSAGKRQTSFASCDVVPDIEDEIDIEIADDELKIDTYRASGAGGQHINKTDSAVRIVHKPTGITVKCQDGRSQHENRATALMTIRSRVYEEHQRKLEEEQGIERRNKIGTGDRAEKIRTYNYPQNRVTDHRIGYTVNQLDRIMEGRMQDLLDALLSADQQAKLAGEK